MPIEPIIEADLDEGTKDAKDKEEKPKPAKSKKGKKGKKKKWNFKIITKLKIIIQTNLGFWGFGDKLVLSLP